MKITTIIFLGITFLLTLSVNVLGDVVVYTNEDISSSSGSSGPKSEGGGTPSEADESKDLSAAGALGVRYILEGNLIADVKISVPVILEQDGTIVDVKKDGGEGVSFSIVRVEKDKEALALSGQSASDVIGKRLSRGTYKVYPDGNLPGSTSRLEKIKVTVYIAIAGTIFPNKAGVK